MEELSIPCAITEGDRLALSEDSRGGRPLVRVDADQYTNLAPAGVAEAAGWLLGWLAEHAPEERIKLDTCHSAAIAESLRVERDHLKGNLEAMQRKLGEAESNYIFAQTNNGRNVADVIAALDAVGAPEGAPPDRVRALAAERDRLKADRDSLEVEREKLFDDLAAIADAVGLGGTRTRWEGQLLGKVENLIADVSDLRVALKRSNADCNTAIAEMHEAKRKSVAYLQMVGELVGAIVRPEVTRG